MSVLDPAHHEGNLAARTVYALVHLQQAARAGLTSSARAEGLTPLQANLLIQVMIGPEAEATVTRLSQATDLTTPTVSDSLRALVEKGLLTRHEDPEDQRVGYFKCTEPGMDVARRLMAWTDSLEKAVGELSDEKQRELLGLLTYLIYSEISDNGYRPVARMCASCKFLAPGAWEESVHYCSALERVLGPLDLRMDCMLHQPIYPPKKRKRRRS